MTEDTQPQDQNRGHKSGKRKGIAFGIIIRKATKDVLYRCHEHNLSFPDLQQLKLHRRIDHVKKGRTDWILSINKGA